MDKNIYETLRGVDVKDFIETKKVGDVALSYLSWAYAIDCVSKIYPDITYEIERFDGKPYLFDKTLGYMVFTKITIQGITKSMWLPVLDGANNAMTDEPYTYSVKGKNGSYEKSVDSADMFNINTSIMRCLVKNLAMFGLGIGIYAGEDLPDDNVKRKDKPTATDNKKKYESYIDTCNRCDSLEKWEKLKPLKDSWVLWSGKTYNEDYAEQLNDKFLELAAKFSTNGIVKKPETTAELINDDIPDFLK